jgi:phage shock protein A
MSTDVNMAKQAVQDKLESQIKTAQARLVTLEARAESAKANAELKAIAELLSKRQVIQERLQELRKTGADRWEQAKADLESRISEFEKSVKELESKAHAKAH